MKPLGLGELQLISQCMRARPLPSTKYPSSSIQAHRNFLRKCESRVRPGGTESQTGDNRPILGSQSHAFAS